MIVLAEVGAVSELLLGFPHDESSYAIGHGSIAEILPTAKYVYFPRGPTLCCTGLHVHSLPYTPTWTERLVL